MTEAETETVSTGYSPRPLQAQIHRSLRRFNVLVCHRRFGKTVLAINELIDRALRCELERPRFVYLAPLYKQAKAIAWDYLKAYTSAIPGVSKHEGELRVDLPNGGRIQLLGADNPDALRGVYLDMAVLDEFAQMDPRAWGEVIRPALADRQGGALFIGTPKGRNAFCDLYEAASAGKLGDEWWAGLYRASETGVIPGNELANLRKQMDENEYEQELECSFQAAIAGAYYGKELSAAERDTRIRRVDWEPALPVTTAWDLGIGDATSIWFVQQIGRQVRVIDFYEASGVGLDHYAKVLKEKPYVYGTHLLPHDTEVTELGTGKSRASVLVGFGIRPTIVRKLGVDDGIQAVRSLLPRCWFDKERCAAGIRALLMYQRDWDAGLGTFKPRPRHDWASHAADAFRYLAVGLRDETPGHVPPSRQTVEYNPLTYGWGGSQSASDQAWSPLD